MTDISGIFPGWKIVESLGKGSFGEVYRIEKPIPGSPKKEYAALKVIHIPRDEKELDELDSRGYAREKIITYCDKAMTEVVEEYTLMYALKGNTNIVYCDRLEQVRHENGIGWDIFIKMELLSPLDKAIGETYQEEETIKLGIDICRALALCRKENIIHRDIKPGNILVSKTGDYKLSDFGVAKVSDRTAAGTVAGTYGYMAPEIALNQEYNATVDIYSLGMVLYWLMNQKCEPFIPINAEIPTYGERRIAWEKRLSGAELPRPVNGSWALQDVVLKACAYDPKNRYQTSEEMMRALERLLGSNEDTVLENRHYWEERQLQEAKKIAEDEKRRQEELRRMAEVKKEKLKRILLAAVIGFLVMGFVVWQIWDRRGKDTNQDASLSAPTDDYVQTVPIEEGVTEAQNMDIPTVENTTGATIAVTVSEDVILESANNFIKNKQYRKAIEILDEAWEKYGDPKYYEAAAQYRFDFGRYNTALLAAGENNTILINNGITRAVGGNGFQELSADGWTDMIAVSAGDKHIVGLKSDGTVISAGSTKTERRNVNNWKNVVALSAGDSHTVALLSDGSVIATGYNEQGQCDVEQLTEAAGEKRIVSIAAGYFHTLALLEDGTVVACGQKEHGACDVQNWNNISAIYAGETFSVGLKNDGTVIVTGQSYVVENWDISEWDEMTNLSAGDNYLIGLNEDGTVVSQGLPSGYVADQFQSLRSWENIIYIAAGSNHTVAITSEGDVLCAGVDNADFASIQGMKINVRDTP